MVENREILSAEKTRNTHVYYTHDILIALIMS